MGQPRGLYWGGLIGLLGGLLLAAGCGSRPRAPALEDSGVFHNPREKVRFLVPGGWVQQQKMDLPPGPVKQERALVIYRHTASPAMLELTVLDMGEDADIKQFLAEKKWVGTIWKSTGEPETVVLGDGKATRY